MLGGISFNTCTSLNYSKTAADSNHFKRRTPEAEAKHINSSRTDANINRILIMEKSHVTMMAV